MSSLSTPSPTSTCHDFPFDAEIAVTLFYGLIGGIVFFCCLSTILTCCLCVVCCYKRRPPSDDNEVRKHWTTVTPVISEEVKFPDGTLLSESTSRTFLSEHNIIQDDTTITEESVVCVNSFSPFKPTVEEIYDSYDEITDDVFQGGTNNDDNTQEDDTTSDTHDYNNYNITNKPTNDYNNHNITNKAINNTGSDWTTVMADMVQANSMKSSTSQDKTSIKRPSNGSIHQPTNTDIKQKRVHYVEIVGTKPFNPPPKEVEPISDDDYVNAYLVEDNTQPNNKFLSDKKGPPPNTKPKPSGRASMSAGAGSVHLPRSRFLSQPTVPHLVQEEHVYMSPRSAGEQVVWKPYKELVFATLEGESDYAVPIIEGDYDVPTFNTQ